MGKMFKRVVLLVMVATMLLGCIGVFAQTQDTQAKTSSNEVPKYVGNFVQSWLIQSWSDEQIDREFKRMQEIGIEYLIYSDYAHKNKDGSWNLYYNNKINLGQNTNYGNVLGKALEACQKYGIKMFIGLGEDECIGNGSMVSPSFKNDFVQFSNQSADIIKDVWNQYGTKYKESIAGFYFSPEFYNYSQLKNETMTKVIVNNLKEGFDITFKTLNSIAPDLPVLMSPYQSDQEGLASMEEYCAFYEQFFTQCGFRDGDIFCPQDSVGAGGLNLGNVEKWLSGYKTMIDKVNDQGVKMKYWVNCENFVQPKEDTPGAIWTAATLDRFTKQLACANKYAEKIITFSDTHYYSPYQYIEGFDKSYRYYLEHKGLEAVKPSCPEKVSLKYTDGRGLQIKWSKSKDDYGISKYQVYKADAETGEFKLLKECLCTNDNGNGGKQPLSVMYDTDKRSETNPTEYQIVAVDCTGNVSDVAYVSLPVGANNNGVDITSDDGETGVVNRLSSIKQYSDNYGTGKVLKEKADAKAKKDKTIRITVFSVALILTLIALYVLFRVNPKKKAPKVSEQNNK